MNIAIYPGSFDPITLGHLDIIRRAARCFDKVCVCVMVNCQKQQPMFTPERRLELIRQSVADIPNVEVENWSGLLADFVRSKDAHILDEGRAELQPTGSWRPRWRASTAVSVPGWRRCCCPPVRRMSTSAPPWCGR